MRRRTQEKTQVKSATNIAQNPLESSHVRLPGIMHVKTNLLNSIGNIWPSEGQILQSTGKTAVIRSIRNRRSITGKLRISINWCGTRVAVSHASTVKNLQHILSLRKEKAIPRTLHMHT